jgi:hypothetical protein
MNESTAEKTAEAGKKVEIFDEEDSIVIDDQYDTTTLEFHADKKNFTASSRLKDDVFYSYQMYEYRITTDPIGLEIRLLESSHEPPKEYSVRDGVVLESEIRKNRFASDRIEMLKKQVEWSKVDLLGHYEVNLYILSKHPEIISIEEYRKFMRQTVERTKSALFKVEQFLKEHDTTGLQIITGADGKHIWYPEGHGCPDDNREDAAEHLRSNILAPLFGKESVTYCGITKEDFQRSDEVIAYLENLLNQKQKPAKKNNTSASAQPIRVRIYKYFAIGLTIVFIFLKLSDSIDWNWFAVLSPFLIWQGLGFVLGFVGGFLRALNKQ